MMLPEQASIIAIEGKHPLMCNEVQMAERRCGICRLTPGGHSTTRSIQLASVPTAKKRARAGNLYATAA
jgi:hypothetical protein